MPKILYVKPLTKEEQITLEEMYKKHPSAACRKRGSAILMSNKGYNVKDISKIYKVRRQTVSKWIRAWDSYGLLGLIDKARSGRPKKLTPEKEKAVLNYIKEEPKKLSKVIANIKNKFGIDVSRNTIKRLCKKAGLSWKRVRQSLRNKRNAEEFENSKKMIEELAYKESKGEIDLYFFDESGFTLVPSVPYAWQPIGERIEVPCSQSKRINVLGFINKSNQFQSLVFEDKIDTSVVIYSFEEFFKIVDKPTYIIMDNAPMHRSYDFMDKIEEWADNNLFIKFLPPYSPELNIIEILWKKIKYEWMPFSAYLSYQSLKEAVIDILGNVGKDYTIQFS